MSDKKQSSDQRIAELEAKIKRLEGSNRLLLKQKIISQFRANRVEFNSIVREAEDNDFVKELQAEGIFPKSQTVAGGGKKIDKLEQA